MSRKIKVTITKEYFFTEEELQKKWKRAEKMSDTDLETLAKAFACTKLSWQLVKDEFLEFLEETFTLKAEFED